MASADATKPETPLVKRVTRDLQALISTDRTMVGGRLPSERDLANQLHASRATVRTALTNLANAGILTPAPQSGWYVSATPLSPPPQRLVSFTELAARRGQVVETRVLSLKERLPRTEEAHFLTCPAGATVLELFRVRILAGRPTCLDRGVLPLWRAPSLVDVDWTTSSLYVALEARGMIPSRSDFVVAAALAGESSDPLEIEPTAPVVEIRERCYDQFGGPALLGFAVYRADSYRFHATLTANRPRTP